MTASSPFLMNLQRALIADFQEEMMLACKVAVLQASGYRRSEIARRLAGETPAALRLAEARVKRASDRLDAGED